MRKKRHLTKTGRYFEEKKPLAARSIIQRPSTPRPGRMPFARLCRYGPTEKLDMSGADLAASFGPSVMSDAIFFLDTSIFSTCTSRPLWDLFLSRQILITPMVGDELLPWIGNPHRNRDIRDLVYESVRRQFVLGEDGASASPSSDSAGVLSQLGIQIRYPHERYRDHGCDYYFKLLSIRKFIDQIITHSLQENLGRPPSNDEFLAQAHPFLGDRGLQLAKKGIENKNPPNLLSDEQTVVMAVLTAILERREVYIVTRDTDLPEQFGKLFLLMKEHYRAMLVAEQYAKHPNRMPFREVPVTAGGVGSIPWVAPSILELRVPEIEFNPLPQKFRSVVVHCILLGGDDSTPKFSYSCFTIDTEAARVLLVKAGTGGLSTDQFGGRNCTIRTQRFTPEQHEVVVSIGKERVARFEGWGEFGADDYCIVLTCCEEVTCIRPLEPRCIVLPSSVYSTKTGIIADRGKPDSPLIRPTAGDWQMLNLMGIGRARFWLNSPVLHGPKLRLPRR